MDTNTVQNILNDMLQSLDEFKSEDFVYYKRQVNRIMEYIKQLEGGKYANRN